MVCIVFGIGGFPVLGKGVSRLCLRNSRKNVSYLRLVCLVVFVSSKILWLSI